MRDVVIFCFAGRRQNMELQLPLIRRILAENPDTEYHVWNLARNEDDNRYLRSIEGERITVLNDHYGDPTPWSRFNDIYRHYTNPVYSDCLFVKVDDDVVFLETDRFRDFVDAVDANRGSVLSAKVVNNGACTPTEPGLWLEFLSLGLPLLDVHLSSDYAQMSHTYFFGHSSEMLNQPTKIIPTDDWLSINTIGYDYSTGLEIAAKLGTPSPPHIAGRDWVDTLLGDEGTVNTLPRLILEGFLTCHLSFGPQCLPFDDLRKRYAEIAEHYLGAA